MAYLDRAFYPIAAVEGFIRGAWIGFGQWWLLRGRLAHSGWWIVLSCLGLTTTGLVSRVFSPLGMLSGFFELISLTLQAGLLGIIQWTYLQGKSKLAKWWIIASIAVGLTQYVFFGFLGTLGPPWWLLDIVSALIWSSIGGITMLIILDSSGTPPKEEIPAPVHALGSTTPQTSMPRATQSFLPTSPPVSESTHTHDQPRRDTTPAASPASAERVPRPPTRPLIAALPKNLILCEQTVAMSATRDANTTASVFDFELLKRPRRARIILVYAGITQATQIHFRQHVQLNGKVLKELPARAQNPEEPKEYQIRIPETVFERVNRLIVVSRSDGTPQNQNHFRLHGLKIDFDWSGDPLSQSENSATSKV